MGMNKTRVMDIEEAALTILKRTEGKVLTKEEKDIVSEYYMNESKRLARLSQIYASGAKITQVPDNS